MARLLPVGEALRGALRQGRGGNLDREVWNEANGFYWKATAEESLKLHDYAVDGVRRALPTARVGGPDCAGAGGPWLRQFLDHCLHGTNYATGRLGTPLDFVSFHAKGSPSFTNGHVRMGLADQLQAIDLGFSIVKSYPELKNIPIVIGESDPDGCAACQGEQLGYRNTTMYSSYTAASFARAWTLARRDGVNLDAALTWAFTFEGQPPFAGFRQLASAGIDLPVLNVFRLFSRMSGAQLAVSSDHEISLEDIQKAGVRGKPDVSALASFDTNHLTVLLWHYHDDDVTGPDAEVNLIIERVPFVSGRAKLTRYAVDAQHGNAFTAWRRMGSPMPLSERQFAELEAAGKLATLGQPAEVRLPKGRLHLNLSLPRQAVALLVLSAASDPGPQRPETFK